MSVPRYAHTATLLPNGTVLVAGGCAQEQCNGVGSAFSSAEVYSPTSGTWTPTGAMTTGRLYHTATLLANGEVLVAGGMACQGNYVCAALASAELYNPATGAWTATGSMATARAYHTATLLPNGDVLVAGGQNCANVVTCPRSPAPSCITRPRARGRPRAA